MSLFAVVAPDGGQIIYLGGPSVTLDYWRGLGTYDVHELATVHTYQDGYIAGWRAALDEVRRASRGTVSISDLIRPAAGEGI